MLRIVGVERRDAPPELVSRGSLGVVLCPAVLYEHDNGWIKPLGEFVK